MAAVQHNKLSLPELGKIRRCRVDKRLLQVELQIKATP